MWIVTDKNSTKAVYTRERLLELFLLKLKPVAEKPQHQELIQAFIDFMGSENIIVNKEQAEAMMAGFSIGYLYRLFLEKNDVMYEQSSGFMEEQRSSSNQEPAVSGN